MLHVFQAPTHEYSAVYLKIIERASACQTNNISALLRCVQLLKSSLSRNLPSQEVLVKIDSFCVEASAVVRRAHTGSPAITGIIKAISFVRALVARGINPSIDPRTLPARAEGTGGAAGSTVDADKDNGREGSGSRRPGNAYTKPSPSASGADNRSEQYLGVSGGGRNAAPRASDVIQLTDSNTTKVRIRKVGMVKKREEIQLYKDTGQRTVRRTGGRPLFLYRYYQEQVPLRLSSNEVKQVVNAVITPSSEEQQERIIASKVLIKVLMDVYSTDATESSVLLSVFLEMVSSRDADTRAHAFSLLFNLSIHVHMFEPLDTSSAEAPPSDIDSSATESTPDKSLHSKPLPSSLEGKHSKDAGEESQHSSADAGFMPSSSFHQIHEDLALKLCEMLLCMVQQDEREDRVWNAALNCMFYFMTTQGKVLWHRLCHVDVRVLAAFVVHSSVGALWGDEVHRYLLQMLITQLYVNGELSEQMIDRIGGVQILVEHYANARSFETRESLFMVLFDYVIKRLSSRRLAIDHEQVSVLLEVLKRFDAAEAFAKFFKVLPDNFVETVVRFVFFEQLKRHPDLHDLSSRLEKSLVVAFLYDIEKLSQACTGLDAEFQEHLQAMMTARPEKLGEHFNVLNALLTSDLVSDRRNGETWLFSLIRLKYESGGGSVSPSLLSATEACLAGLLQSYSADTRRIYLSITEKLMIMLRGKAGDENKLPVVFKIINDYLTKMVQRSEKNEQLLMYMLDIVMDVISIRTVGAWHGEMDNVYAMFLEGYASVSESYVREVSHVVFRHVFLYLSCRTYPAARATALVLLLQKCKMQRTVFQEVGGHAFFREVLKNDRDPAAIYHVSQFLLDHLMTDNAAEYRQYLNQLLVVAQQTNNETLLQNPYSQIKAIEML
mmetsp:Transcript_43738/g.71107  ORF Transcript_43738/g.71107 Transcript_43738/m.71107 type:complete len:893 (+) Transcript_43738:253-2931(+)